MAVADLPAFGRNEITQAVGLCVVSLRSRRQPCKTHLDQMRRRGFFSGEGAEAKNLKTLPEKHAQLTGPPLMQDRKSLRGVEVVIQCRLEPEPLSRVLVGAQLAESVAE